MSKKHEKTSWPEWLRRWTANPLGFPRVGSNPIFVDYFCRKCHQCKLILHIKYCKTIRFRSNLISRLYNMFTIYSIYPIYSLVRQKKVCLRSPDRLTLFSPNEVLFIVLLKVFFIEDHIEKKVNRTTLREVMRV